MPYSFIVSTICHKAIIWHNHSSWMHWFTQFTQDWMPPHVQGHIKLVSCEVAQMSSEMLSCPPPPSSHLSPSLCALTDNWEEAVFLSEQRRQTVWLIFIYTWSFILFFLLKCDFGILLVTKSSVHRQFSCLKGLFSELGAQFQMFYLDRVRKSKPFI